MRKLLVMAVLSLVSTAAFAESSMTLRSVIMEDGIQELVQAEEIGILNSAMNSKIISSLSRGEKINLLDAVLHTEDVKELEDIRGIRVVSALTCDGCYEVEVSALNGKNKSIINVRASKEGTGYGATSYMLGQ